MPVPAESDLGHPLTLAGDAQVLLDGAKDIQDEARALDEGLRELYSLLISKLADRLGTIRSDGARAGHSEAEIQAAISEELGEIFESEDPRTKEAWTVRRPGLGRSDFSTVEGQPVVRLVHESLPLVFYVAPQGVVRGRHRVEGRHLKMLLNRTLLDAGRIKTPTGTLYGRHAVVIGVQGIDLENPQFPEIASVIDRTKPEFLGKLSAWVGRLNLRPGWGTFRYAVEVNYWKQAAILALFMGVKSALEGENHFQWQVLAVSAVISIGVVTFSSARETIMEAGSRPWSFIKYGLFGLVCATLYRLALHGVDQDWYSVMIRLIALEALSTPVKRAWDWKRQLRSETRANRGRVTIRSLLGQDFPVRESVLEKQHAFLWQTAWSRPASLGLLPIPFFPSFIDGGVLAYLATWPIQLYRTVLWAEKNHDPRIGAIRQEFERSIPYRVLSPILNPAVDLARDFVLSLGLAGGCSRALSAADFSPEPLRVREPAPAFEDAALR